MKILRASPFARVSHLPKGIPGSALLIPLCFPDSVVELGVLADGVVSCERCRAALDQLIIDGDRVLQSTEDPIKRRGIIQTLMALRQLQREISNSFETRGQYA